MYRGQSGHYPPRPAAAPLSEFGPAVTDLGRANTMFVGTSAKPYPPITIRSAARLQYSDEQEY